jgi:hypothetical protein
MEAVRTAAQHRRVEGLLFDGWGNVLGGGHTVGEAHQPDNCAKGHQAAGCCDNREHGRFTQFGLGAPLDLQ